MHYMMNVMNSPPKDVESTSREPYPPLEGYERMRVAKFGLGQVVRHRLFSFRGVVFDIDPVFANTEEWWLSIPEDVRPRKDQPFYHLLAENSDSEYIAYVSEQNLALDTSADPISHSQIEELFERDANGSYRMKILRKN
jgi:heat shock protein HspQ